MSAIAYKYETATDLWSKNIEDGYEIKQINEISRVSRVKPDSASTITPIQCIVLTLLMNNNQPIQKSPYETRFIANLFM